MACSMWLLRLAFCSYVALTPFVVWQYPWFASTFCDDAEPWLAWWSGVVVLNFSYRSEFDASFLCGCRVCLHVVVSFVIFVVVTFVFAWLRSQMDELVSWLPKSILVLLEGGTAWGWRCSGAALLEGGAAWGWRCSEVALVVYMDRRSMEYLLITAKHRCNSMVINWCLLSYSVKVINKQWADHRTMLYYVFSLVSPKCLGGKRLRCLGSKFLHCVNASAPASTWMVRYAISSRNNIIW